jgi:predicted membrane channel-forming protein YqfA (hemolysin III family)
MRLALIIGTFLPFAFYGMKDNAFHFRGRKVTAPEHLIHLAIGITQAAILIQALRGDLLLMFTALVLMLIVGGIDEYIFHRGLPGEESDLHAKQHLALLIFVVMAVATTYLERNHWKLPWPA